MQKRMQFVIGVLTFIISVGPLAAAENDKPTNDEIAKEAAAEPQTEVAVTPPNLAEIIPLAAELSGRLAALKSEVEDKLVLPSLETDYAHIQTNIDRHDRALQRLKDSGDYRTAKLIAVLQKIQRENERLDFISKPFIKEIGQLGERRGQWLKEQGTWTQWQSAWLKDEAPEQVHSVFARANETITAALNLIDSELGTVLAEQEKVGEIQQQIFALNAELDRLIMEKRFGEFLSSSPPMFSSDYFSQFTADMWKEIIEGMEVILGIRGKYLGQLGWVVLIELVVFGVLITFIYRNRQALHESTYWRFIDERAISAGLFLVCMITMLIYEYKEFPLVWKLANYIIIAVSFARLVSNLTQIAWQRYFVYGLTALLITDGLLEFLNFPIPLFRLFIVLSGMIGLICCWKWSNENKRLEGRMYYTRLLRLASVFFTIIVIAEIWGIESLAFYLFASVTKTTAIVLIFLIFIRLLYGAVDWLFHKSALRKAAVLYSDDIDSIIRRIMHLVNITVCVLILLPGILMIWGVYDSLERATIGFWTLGFNIGSQRLSVGLAIIVMAVLYGSFFVSWIFQRLFLDVLLRKQQIQRGVRVSIERLIHYSVIFVGFMLAISLIGIDLTKFTIMISALGVGIGFGLQGVVNNFVSGLILLFERPIRQGDIIQVGGTWAEVKKIGLRSTTVLTYDQADLIIPNADLTTNQVTNWTLSSQQVRLVIPVGVAYGSDVPRVFEILAACAHVSEIVVNNPEPRVLFLKFGESSLDFELHVWIKDMSGRLVTRSQLHQEIDRRFREAHIEIAFPQRDLHIHSIDESAKFQ